MSWIEKRVDRTPTSSEVRGGNTAWERGLNFWHFPSSIFLLKSSDKKSVCNYYKTFIQFSLWKVNYTDLVRFKHTFPAKPCMNAVYFSTKKMYTIQNFSLDKNKNIVVSFEAWIFESLWLGPNPARFRAFLWKVCYSWSCTMASFTDPSHIKPKSSSPASS